MTIKSGMVRWLCAVAIVIAMLVGMVPLAMAEAAAEVPAVEETVENAEAAEDAIVEPAADAAEIESEVATDAPAEEPTAAPTEDIRPAVADDVIATIGGTEIKADAAMSIYNYLVYVYGSYYGYDVSEPELAAIIKDQAIEYTVDNYARDIVAANLGLADFTDEEKAAFTTEAQAEYDAAYESFKGSMTDATKTDEEIDAEVKAELENYGYNLDEMTEQLRQSAVYDRITESVKATVNVTDEDVAAKYAETVAADKEQYAEDLSAYAMQCMYGSTPAYTPEGIRLIKHILISYLEDDATKISELTALTEKPEDYDEQLAALKAAAYENIKAKIDEIQAKIASGEDFDALVAEYGEDPGMQQEPYISEGYPTFAGDTSMVSEFVDGAMALAMVGDVSAEPVLSTYGAHILKYSSDRVPGEVALTDDAAATLKDELQTEAVTAEMDALIEACKTEQVVYTYPEHFAQ